MKKWTILLAMLPMVVQAQIDYNRGSLALSFFKACPQNQLKDIEYDDGAGAGLAYLSRHFSFNDQLSFQYGVRMDFGDMKDKEFAVDLATPVPDEGKVKVQNSMYGTFLEGRFNLNYQRSVTPFASVLIGHRSYTTSNTISANNPELNPDVETVTYEPRIIHTNRFHAGGIVGVTYSMTQRWKLDGSVTYTYGALGVVQPLKDVYQLADQNEINYDYQTSRTDMLLINVGIRLVFVKNQRRPISHSDEVENPPVYRTPRTTTPTQVTTPKTTTPPSGGDTKTEEKAPAKKPLKIKSDSKDVRH